MTVETEKFRRRCHCLIKVLVCSLILSVFLLCGCVGPPVGYQDVENMTALDFSYDSGNRKYNYSFDLVRGVFCVHFENGDQEDPVEYELAQTDIEAIRNSLRPAGKWTGDFHHSSPGLNYPHNYTIDITYSDDTDCVLKGVSANGSKWPEGFEELKSTLDGIVQAGMN